MERGIAVWIGGFPYGASESFSQVVLDPTAYMNRHHSDPFPPKIMWKATDRRFGRHFWLSIDS